jgi:hypothetical protein
MANIKRSGLGLVLAGVGVLAVGCATASEDQKLPTYSETRTERATATVVKIDQKTRQVSLKANQSGEVFDFVAGPQVKNLAQVQVGDQVVVEYVESIALEVKRVEGATPDLTVAEGAGSAEKGANPAGAVGRQVTISAVIVAIDKPNLRVTVRGPAGKERVLQAKDPKKLDAVKIGDIVVVTYTEALGVKLEKVAK